MIKLRFKKWWMYFFPSLRRWLRECQKHMNSDEFRARYNEIAIDCVMGIHKENLCHRPPGLEKLRKRQDEIVEHFKN